MQVLYSEIYSINIKIIAIDPEICMHKTSTSHPQQGSPPKLLLEPPFPHQVLRSQL